MRRSDETGWVQRYLEVEKGPDGPLAGGGQPRRSWLRGQEREPPFIMNQRQILKTHTGDELFPRVGNYPSEACSISWSSLRSLSVITPPTCILMLTHLSPPQHFLESVLCDVCSLQSNQLNINPFYNNKQHSFFPQRTTSLIPQHLFQSRVAVAFIFTVMENIDVCQEPLPPAPVAFYCSLMLLAISVENGSHELAVLNYLLFRGVICKEAVQNLWKQSLDYCCCLASSWFLIILSEFLVERGELC